MHITSADYEETEAKGPVLQDILVALSFALDLTEGAVPGHAIRSCLLAVRLALSVNLDLDTISDLYYACLLKDVGCSSNSARMCQIVGGDDRIVKAAAKLEDWTQPHRYKLSTVKLLWEQVLPGASVIEKGARLLKMGVTQHRNNRELIELRCDRGAQIVRKLGLGNQVAIGVRHLDEHWDGCGYPGALKGEEIPIISRLMCIAQHLDAFCMDQGPQVAIDTLCERAGRWFDPELVRATVQLDRSRTLWRECLPGSPVEETRRAILSLHPKEQALLSASDVDTICQAFADVVDAKSPFTFRHSLGVQDASVAIGNTLGLSDRRIQVLCRAALLHDVGKLSIPNTILDKPTRLTDSEFTLVKSHPGLSTQILNRVQAFREIAVLAGEHHERLDGSGYPFGLTGEDLSIESRIIAVADVFAALSEHRPYREALGVERIRSIMERDIPEKLDRECYAALCVVMEDLTQSVPERPLPANIPRYVPNLEVVETFI
jgi:HD-GYP domain-containing protein (c-di-GMP phosphodiesterase class II)